MSLPDGVTTCLLTYGPITDTFGNLAESITVEVVADRTIVHAASGRTLFKNPVTVTADGGGVAQLPVPHTDQSGFRDQQQNSLTGWYYSVRLTARFGATGVQTDVKTFQPLSGQTTVDADLLPSDGMVTPGVTAPTATVTSVAGFTGAVTADDLAAAVPDTGWRDITSLFDDFGPYREKAFIVRVQGNEVEFLMDPLGAGPGTGLTFADLSGASLPVGVRPRTVPGGQSASVVTVPLVGPDTLSIGTLTVFANGSLSVLTEDFTTNRVMAGRGMWKTDDTLPSPITWPTVP